LPKKKGFFRKKEPLEIVNLGKINEKFNKGEVVSPQTLLAKKLIKKLNCRVKILGDGNLDRPLIFEKLLFSKSAIQKIKQSKGEIKEE